MTDAPSWKEAHARRVAKALGLLKHQWGTAYDEPGGAVCSGCKANYGGIIDNTCPGAKVPGRRMLRARIKRERKQLRKRTAELEGLLRALDTYKETDVSDEETVDEDGDDPAYLLDLAERLREIPVMHGVDGGDIARLEGMAKAMREGEVKVKMAAAAKGEAGPLERVKTQARTLGDNLRQLIETSVEQGIERAFERRKWK